MEGYAYPGRDSVGIRLVQAPQGTDMHASARQQHCYIEVENIESLYTGLKPKLEVLPAGRVRPLSETFYGVPEFHVIDENALLTSFGEAIAPE